MSIDTKDILDTLRHMAESISSGPGEEYPEEALPLGTWVRSDRLDRLGFVTDAFYAGQDLDGQRIIIYSLLLLPKIGGYISHLSNNDQYYLTNEYEYEVTAYLMMNPINIAKLMMELTGREL